MEIYSPIIKKYNSLPHRKNQMRFVDYYIIKRMNRLKLRLFCRFPKHEDITVIIPIKNRGVDRLDSTLKSFRNQDYNQNLINIIIIDYDSKKELIPKFMKLCNEYDVNYIRVNNKPVWNLSHATNIAIKRTRTKYILCTGEDLIFEKNYIKESIKELKKKPFQVVLSYCLDLPKGVKRFKDFEELKTESKGRFGKNYISTGVNLTIAYFYKKIRGYDEKLNLWGGQDDDIIKRLKLLGLKIHDISDKTCYLHQYHTKFKFKKEYNQSWEKNKKYCMEHHSIIRNKNKWGKL